MAEEVASSAMKAAGAAVLDEMEAAAVVKETQAALSKALRSVKSLMPAEDTSTAEEERTAMQCALNPMLCVLKLYRIHVYSIIGGDELVHRALRRKL